ncbi:small nuclear ribonucleoprotein F isoform X2 [Myotis lucifugus]|uniref:small nuclear ribonucleoprotein F isoform X2 n=1 Tax=Myotis lucifugus TaxID=59463 RepID=UPI000CCC63F8|nr:small nuclear ribonucleoprotein F isoform X2 [Myotis lucifugus]
MANSQVEGDNGRGTPRSQNLRESEEETREPRTPSSETAPASLPSQSRREPPPPPNQGAEASQRPARKEPKHAASLVARIHCSPSHPISTYLFASNHRSGRAVVGGERSRCFWAAISRGPCWGRRSRHQGRTRAGSAASSLQHLLVVAMLANTEEYIDGALSGHLGEVLIRCNNVLYIRGVEEEEEDGEMRE